jgi:hypothetical protein
LPRFTAIKERDSEERGSVLSETLVYFICFIVATPKTQKGARGNVVGFRHNATSRNIASLIPYEIIGFFD